MKVPVAKATEETIWQLKQTLRWHQKELEVLSPKNPKNGADIRRHKQIVTSLEVEILSYHTGSQEAA